MFTRDKILIQIPSYLSAFYVDKIHFVHTCDKLCREFLSMYTNIKISFINKKSS